MPKCTPNTRRAVAKAINEGFNLADTKRLLLNETRIHREEGRLPRSWHQGGFPADEAAVGDLLGQSVVEFIVTKAREFGGLPEGLHETLVEEFKLAYPTWPDAALMARTGEIISEVEARLPRLSRLNEGAADKPGVEPPAPWAPLAKSASSVKRKTSPTIAKNSIRPKVRLNPQRSMLTDGQIAHRAVARIANAKAKGLKA
jgi:hypothetical protein